MDESACMLAVKRFIIHIFMIFQLIFLLSTSLVWAENTTTLDQSAEQVVVKQILDTQKNKESSSAQSPNTELSNKNISVQNDLAEGQIRELPSVTAPKSLVICSNCWTEMKTANRIMPSNLKQLFRNFSMKT